MRPYADLHTHTECSDGTLPPERLVQRAAERGLHVLSVTDHDTVEGVEAASKATEALDLQLVAGVELSITVDGTEVHLLAYGVDPTNSSLQKHLRSMRTARQERVRRIVERLRGEGIDLDDDVLEEEIQESSSVGRPHVAEALVRAGHVDTIRQAFDRYLGREGPGFVAKPEFPAQDALAMVHQADGIGVLAHPGHWTSSACIRHLVDAGLDGIETVHPSHDASLRQYYERLARGYDVLTTGGSDYHGRSEDEDAHFGTLGMSQAEWERFQEAAL